MLAAERRMKTVDTTVQISGCPMWWIFPVWRAQHTDRITARARPAERASGSEAGFTLVEVLVVLAIMGLIMSLIGPRVLNYLSDAKVKTARIQVETLASAVELFFIDNGRYPLESEGLEALVTRPGNLRAWNGPYIKGAAIPLDPWSKPYHYASDRGMNFTVTFVGPDGKEASNRVTRAENVRASGL
jgi:general secretion pathway protein G